MASHSPQRTRRQPQTHSMNQGMPANVQLRESSQSPPPLRERPRASKTQSMPLIPQTAQIFGQGSAAQQMGQPPLQASPTGSGSSRRSPPPAPAVASQRLHATPPLTNLQGEARISPPLSQISQNQNTVNSHYAHPTNRLPLVPPLSQYQHSDSSYGITAELMADIDLADFHQSQTQTQTQSVASAYGTYPRGDSATPPKDLNVSRVRTAERASPREFDNAHQHRQRESSARESPKVRQSNSPTHPAFVQVKSNTPERRESPARSSPMASSSETYVAYSARESPPVHKRSLNAAANVDSRAQQYSLATSTPPLQAIPVRSSGRSLPVQEEPEDDPRMALKHDFDLQEGWNMLEQHHRQFSPAPSSDLHPEGNVQRFDHPGHPVVDTASGSRRTGNYDAHYKEDEDDDDASDEAHTPRSPSVGLPDNYSANSMQPSAISGRLPPRMAPRNGSMDQYGLRGIDQTIYQPVPQPIPSGSAHSTPMEHPQQYQDPRKLNINPHMQPQNHGYPSPASQNGYYHPEDYHHYGAYTPYHDDYSERIRPDAPIPPTPHSQTAAPSPSPLISATSSRNGKNYATPSPIVPVGSPYPFPYNHMRRRYMAPDPKHPQSLDPHDQEAIREQMARQWQIYAQNGNMGEMSDSTFSPSATPFQGAFNHWANFYVQRTLGRALDPHGRSRQSSPSHDSMRFSPAPMLYKKKQQASKLSSEISSHKPQPPPRVESTQPRETSPELSSSGEETAGGEQFPTTPRNSWNNGVVPEHVEEDDGNGDWVDEDAEPDEDDMLELEYHPSFINSVSKRRRKWEIGWETLVEAFQALDRQTDATMVLLAAPSHSTKLYSLRSRSVRRQAMQTNAPDMTPLRVGFRRIAAHRRNARSLPKSSLIDRFLVSSSSSGEGSDGSEVREGELKRALEAAVTSLGAFRHIFEEREVRWMEEMRKNNEERERIANVLAQVLGEQHASAFSGGPLG